MIAGDKIELQQFKNKLLSEIGKNVVNIIELEMNGAFHTCYFEPVAAKLKDVLTGDGGVTFHENENVYVFSNYRGSRYSSKNFSTLIQRQVCSQVNWLGVMHSIQNSCELRDVYEMCCAKPFLARIYSKFDESMSDHVHPFQT